MDPLKLKIDKMLVSWPVPNGKGSNTALQGDEYDIPCQQTNSQDGGPSASMIINVTLTLECIDIN